MPGGNVCDIIKSVLEYMHALLMLSADHFPAISLAGSHMISTKSVYS